MSAARNKTVGLPCDQIHAVPHSPSSPLWMCRMWKTAQEVKKPLGYGKQQRYNAQNEGNSGFVQFDLLTSL